MSKKFDEASNEIKRQSDILLKIDESLNQKLTFVIGFTVILIGLLFTQSNFFAILKITRLNILFIIGLTFVFFSGILGLLGYKPTKWNVGVDVKKVLNKENYSKYSTNAVISKFVYEANKRNEWEIKEKSRYFKCSYWILLIGMGLLVISQIIYRIWFNA